MLFIYLLAGDIFRPELITARVTYGGTYSLPKVMHMLVYSEIVQGIVVCRQYQIALKTLLRTSFANKLIIEC